MDEIFEELLNDGIRNINNIVSEYEAYLAEKFNIYSLNNSDVFYSQLNRKTTEAKSSCIESLISSFKKICVALSIPLFKDVLSVFSKSVKSYISSAFSQYKSVYTSLFSKAKESLSEQALRESLFKDIVAARSNIRDYMLGKEDIVISVGKRSFKLSNYLRIVAEQEVRSKFNLILLKKAKVSGAIGIKISDHNTKTKLCDLYEGKTYYFANNGLAELKNGLPPFHVNCQHFIIPVYAHK